MPVGGSLLLPFQIFVPDPLDDLGPISVDERFSTLISTLMPQYVQDDHQKFISFIKAYFEYLEIHGNPRAEAVRLETYTDIDRTLDDFVEFFKSTYLYNFPDSLADGSSEDLAIKNSSDFYGQKGNSLSINYLFKILFNTTASVDTPKDKLFKISDSDYSPNTILFSSHYNGKESLLEFRGSQIEQRILDDFDSDVVARALIDDITFHLDDGVEYAKIFLKEVRGKFKPNHYIEFYRSNRNRKIIERSFPIVSNLSIVSKGRNYAVGDDITVTDSGNKLVLSSEVTTVNSLGEVQSISSTPQQNKIFFAGETYTISIFSAAGLGAGFTLDGNNATSTNRNTFNSSRSLLSSESFIQDNFRFQSFSYVIKAEKQLREYADLVRKIFHPAGSVMLAEYTNTNTFSGVQFDDLISTNINTLEPVIGNFLPYTFAATADFRGDTYDASGTSVFLDYYPDGFNGITAATIGALVGSGSSAVAATVDPFNGGSFLYGPIGGFTFAGVNPDTFFDVTDERPGYRAVQLPQVRYRLSDDINDKYYQIARHPKTMITQNFAGLKNALDKNHREPVTNRYTKNQFGITSIIKRRTTLYLDNSAGITPGFSVNDVIRQKIPNKPEAVGVITSIDEVRDSFTNFYTNTSVNQIIKDFNKKRSALDVGSEVEVAETISSKVSSPIGNSFSPSLVSSQSLENTDTSLLSYAESTPLLEVDTEVTKISGLEKESLTVKTSNETPSSIVKENPSGKFQTSIKTSEVIQPETLKAFTLTVDVISGEFSNETDRNGERFQVTSDSAGSGLLATGLNNDKSVKGTGSVFKEFTDDVEIMDVRISEFLNYLETGPNGTPIN